MSLVPWSNRRTRRNGGALVPGSSALSLRSDVDRLFDRLFTRPWLGFEEDFAPADALLPAIDVSDNDKELLLRAEIPGVSPEDVQVTISDNFLTVAGEKSESKEEKDENYYHCERRFGSFKRTIELPRSSKVDDVSAEFTDGILTVRVPKLEASKPKHVEVKPGAKEKTQRRVAVNSA